MWLIIFCHFIGEAGNYFPFTLPLISVVGGWDICYTISLEIQWKLEKLEKHSSLTLTAYIGGHNIGNQVLYPDLTSLKTVMMRMQ